MNEQVSSVINAKVRTLETRIIPNKKDPEGSNLLNGAGNGTISEPDFEIFSIIDTEETILLSTRIEKLIAA